MSGLQPKVSVVVPFFNRNAEVEKCLRAVLSQELPDGMTFEVVAVDNGSTDGTREKLQALPVRLVDCSRRGPAAARNAGIRAACGEIVALTDSDCVPEPGWLAALIAPFEVQDMLAAGGRIEALDVTCGVALFTERNGILDQKKLFDGVFCFPPFFATANAAFRRDALVKTDGFDEDLRIGEDSDLLWRVLDLGGKIAYCDKARVRHAHRTTFRGFFRQAVDYGMGAANVFAKHREHFGVRYLVEWDSIIALALVPLSWPFRLLFARSPIGRKWCLYEAIWRTGFSIGRIKASITNRCAFL